MNGGRCAVFDNETPGKVFRYGWADPKDLPPGSIYCNSCNGWYLTGAQHICETSAKGDYNFAFARTDLWRRGQELLPYNQLQTLRRLLDEYIEMQREASSYRIMSFALREDRDRLREIYNVLGIYDDAREGKQANDAWRIVMRAVDSYRKWKEGI